MTVRQLAGVVTAIVRNVVWGGNLASLSLVGKPRQFFIYVSENISFCRALNGKRGLSQKNVFEVLPSPAVESVQLGALDAGGVCFTSLAGHTADAINLSLLCRILKPTTVFEIGTLRGYTAFQFALNTPDNAKIYTLDLPTGNSASLALHTTVTDDLHIANRAQQRRYYFDGHPVAAKIVHLAGDSARFDYAPYHGKVDLFFIDGAHSYEYVRSDTQHALQCCHSGSVIVWHDFGRIGVNGVTRWLREFSRDHKVYAVPGGSLAFMLVP